MSVRTHRAVHRRTSPRRSLSVFLAAFALLFVGAGLASASDVDVAIVDTTVPTASVTLAPGASSAITINLSVTGNQVGTATFEVYRDWTLSGGTFTGSNPQEFTVSPRAGGDPATTFQTTGTVSVASTQANGVFTLAASAFDITNSNQTGGKLAVGDASSYQVTVAGVAPPADTTAPQISYVLDPPAPLGDNGWYTVPVTLTWTVTEPDSPSSLVKTGCVDQTITADQTEVTYSCSATSDGGSAGPVEVSIKKDGTVPEVSLVGGPDDGGSYYFGFVPDEPTCTASDATSGLAGDCSVSGYGTAVGHHTVSASATDNAGNSNTATADYDVLAWTLSGFYAPVDLHGVLNTVKGGSTVPLKFEIFAGDTELTDVGAIASFTTSKVTCSGDAPTDTVEITSTGGTSLRYDTTGGQFIQNWKTPTTKGQCYRATMTTDDGSSISALFQIK